MKLPLIALCVASTLPLAAAAQSYGGPRIVTGSPVLAFSGLYAGVLLERGNGEMDATGDLADAFELALGTKKFSSPAGMAVGLRAGFDIRSGNMVYGALVDVKRSWFEDRTDRVIAQSASVVSWETKVDSTTTAALRVGYDVGGVMVYGLAGYSWMDASLTMPAGTYDDTVGALTYGGGFETQIGYNLSGYLELRSFSGKFENDVVTADLDFSNITIGVNYRF
ncbi:outer-membrane immunogenic protein precursor [Ketogulonicigenium robustum]|uniref:Outer-membrane immunogenic protein n=1 Tax=Ketogulonicigenium robustum TaxID=92947 RepID=A0A1W6NZ58_9RHOB|nr:outer membrane beta-barrel protein [Ketogulonicigenium robustum]ARO14532.1 outer-membrane immunogenic protein precursor [Ketogulonicigenium robustum]